MKKSTIIAVATILIVAAIIVVYYLFNPAQYSFFPRCPSKLITGYDCPGCGTQRAFHALLNGNIAEALHYNATFVHSSAVSRDLFCGGNPKKKVATFPCHNELGSGGLDSTCHSSFMVGGEKYS